MSLLPFVLAVPAGLAPLAPQEDVYVQTRQMLPEPPSSVAMDAAVADFDVDGDADLLVAMLSGPHLFLRNAGGALFDAVPSALPAVVSPAQRVFAGDLDGDGDPDAVMLGPYQEVEVYRNSGAVFAVEIVPTTYPDPDPPGDVGDFDNDGDLDLFAATWIGQCYVMRNQDGTLVPTSPAIVPIVSGTPRDLRVGDLNADGDLDVVLASSFSNVLFGSSGLKFQDPRVALGISAKACDVGDLDGDGDLDAYLGGGEDDAIAWNGGTADFTLEGVAGIVGSSDPILMSLVRFADLDGDGSLDVTAADDLRTLVLAGQGGGAFAVASDALPTTMAFHALALGDLDGDLDVDAVGFSSHGAVARLLLNDDGAFAEAQSSIVGLTATQITADTAVGDVNGDGYADVVVANEQITGGDRNDLWLGGPDGDLTRTEGALVSSADTCTSVELADLDDDGDLDAAFGRIWAPGSVHLGDGAGAFTTHPDGAPYGFDEIADLAAGDLDGDGDVDLAVARGSSSKAVETYVNDGGADFASGAVASAPDALTTIALVDADGDGDLDVVAGGGPALLLANDGSGHLDPEPAFGAGALARRIAPGDVDVDGDVDLLLLHDGGLSTLQIGDGAGSFAASAGWSDTSKSAVDGALEDVDGDLDLDLIVVASDQPDATAFENRLFQNDGLAGFGPHATFGANGVLRPSFLDVDGDGDRDLVGGRAFTLYTRVGGGQVARASLARAGQPLFLEVHADAGEPWTLAFAPKTASIPAGALGTLLLEPTGIGILASGVAPASGKSRVELDVPADPVLVGGTAYWQALVGIRLTNREAATVSTL